MGYTRLIPTFLIKTVKDWMGSSSPNSETGGKERTTLRNIASSLPKNGGDSAQHCLSLSTMSNSETGDGR